MTFRHELKYIIHQADYHILRIRIASLLKRDKMVNEGGFYTVRSLYFDDYANTAYNEKDISIFARQKYRIRIYNHSSDPIHLERKMKFNNYINKSIAPLEKEDVDRILDGEYGFLMKKAHPTCQAFYHELRSYILRPRVVVDYEREPFVLESGTVRITFDHHVRAGMDSLDIFNPGMVMAEALDSGFLIMEVKFSEFLPDPVRRLLLTQSVNYSSVSKYMLACGRTLYKRQTDI